MAGYLFNLDSEKAVGLNIFKIGMLALTTASSVLCATPASPERWMAITVPAPPAVLEVSDVDGNISGFDFGQELRADGFPIDPYNALLKQIPNSNADFQNVESDIPGETGGKETTGWVVEISDVGVVHRSTFDIRLKGLRDGVVKSEVTVWEKTANGKIKSRNAFFVTAVKENQISTATIVIDEAGDVKISKKAVAIDLVGDIDLICKEDLIASATLCDAFKAMATVSVKLIDAKDCAADARLLDTFEDILRKLHSPVKDLDWDEWRRGHGKSEFEKQCSPFFGFKKKKDYVPSPAYDVLLTDVLALKANCTEMKDKGEDRSGQQQGDKNGHRREHKADNKERHLTGRYD